MNPVDLIRELAEALDTWTTGLPATHRDRELLRQTQAFLAAQPVVVEVGRHTVVHELSEDTPYLQGRRVQDDIWVPGLTLPNGTPCTVHVVVIPQP